MNQVAFLLLYPILWGFSILPMRVLYGLSSACYYLVYYVFGYRKAVVKQNLQRAFPNRSERDLKVIGHKFYRHLCDLIFESLKSLTISERELKKRFTYINLEYFDGLKQTGKSGFIMCGHYASWEWSFMMPSLVPFEGIGVYKKLKNPYFDRLVRKIRGRFEGILVANKEFRQYLNQQDAQGIQTLSMIISDQAPRSNTYKTKLPFLGVESPFFTGTEFIARELDYALVYLKIEKIKRGYYQGTVVPLSDDPSALPELEVTRRFLHELEQQIYTAPEFYLWSHKRWKHLD